MSSSDRRLRWPPAWKRRRHHNNRGDRTIKSGACEREVRRIARKLGIPYGMIEHAESKRAAE